MEGKESKEAGEYVDENLGIVGETSEKSQKELELMPLTGGQTGGNEESHLGGQNSGVYTTKKWKTERWKKKLTIYGSIVCGCCVLITLCCCVGLVVGAIYLGKYVIMLENREWMKRRRNVLVISIDAFRYDFFKLYPNSFPNIKKYVIDRGIKLDKLQPIYPTKTFPNHYSIATGLYPVRNGLVANTMYDPVFHDVFSLRPPEVLNSSWYDGEPIWISCEKDSNCKSNILFWPGSEVAFNGIRPSSYLKYDQSLSYEKRVDYILASFRKDRNDRPNLVMGYFEGVDTAAHLYGPQSDEVEQAIEDVDSALGKLFRELSKDNVLDLIDIIILSDHGMTEISDSRRIDIDKILDVSTMNEVNIYNYGPFCGLWMKNRTASDILQEKMNSIVTKLKNDEEMKKHANVYLKKDIPWRFQLHNGTYTRRIADIFVMMEDEWSITLSTTKNLFRDENLSFLFLSGKEERRGNNPSQLLGKGAHGYDNELEHMQASFTATGPRIADKGGEIVPGFINVHIFPLLCELLKIDNCPVVDGSLDISQRLLK